MYLVVQIYLKKTSSINFQRKIIATQIWRNKIQQYKLTKELKKSINSSNSLKKTSGINFQKKKILAAQI